MNEIIPFDFNDATVRVLQDENGEPWFVAMDVAGVLGYSDAHKMTGKLDDDEKQNRLIGGSEFNNKGTIVINEPGLYGCILTSQKPEAKPFKRWVTHEVLPAIRKTGGYQAKPMTEMEIIAVTAQHMVQIEQRQAVVEEKLRLQNAKNDQIDTQIRRLEIDTRNGVPLGYRSRKQAYTLYSRGLSKCVFEQALTLLEVTLHKYVHTENGRSTHTFAWKDDEIAPAIDIFIEDAVQVSPTQCQSAVLGDRRFRLMKATASQP